MQRRWSFPPSRILDGLLVIFVINGLLVASSVVVRYAAADDPEVQETVNTAEPPIDLLPTDVPPPPELETDAKSLESLEQDKQFQEFVEIAAEQFPEYLGSNSSAMNGAEALPTVTSGLLPSQNSEPVGSDKLRELEERLMVVSDLNQAAIRLARLAHRQAAADRTEQSRQSLQLSQQLQEISARLLQTP